MKCRECGTEIADKALICFRCGASVDEPVHKPYVAMKKKRPLLVYVLLVIAVLVGLLIGAAVLLRAAPDFEGMARGTIADLASGAYDKVVARFDQKMTAGLPREKLAAAWTAVLGQAGPFKGVTSVRVDPIPAQKIHVVDATAAFEKMPLVVRLALDDEGKIAGLFFLPAKPAVAEWRPPAYADESAFTEAAVAVGAFGLPGTLSLPKQQGRVPAAVLVHGSGPQDRDETIGGNKVFKDLAWGLASRGIVVLRYDKRSLVAPMKTGTVKEETIDDAVAGVELLAGHAAVDSSSVFVIGHSLGAMLAPRIAAASAEVDGLVVMAGTTRPLEEVIVEQMRYLKGADSPEMAQAEQFARRVKDPMLRPDTSIAFMGMPMPAGYWLDLRGYHPEVLAAELRKPIFVLQGGRDYQVTLADFEGWKRALDGRAHATLKLYRSLNHLFIAGEGKSMPDEYLRPGHVDRQVVLDIADWISRN